MNVQFTAAARAEALEAFDYYIERSEQALAVFWNASKPPLIGCLSTLPPASRSRPAPGAT